MSGELKFDKMEEDTKLAQEYLNSLKAEFHSDDFEENSSFILDDKGNKIYRSKLTKKRSCNIKPDTVTDHIERLKLLSIILEDKIGLICELEYMIRKRPFRVTKLDLQMIIKNMCNSWTPYVDNAGNTLVMKEDSSLLVLGYIAQVLPTTIIATRNCAAVCHLFRNLCKESGLMTVTLAFIDENEPVEESIIKDRDLQGGCIGVVTANSDVDSAVETFLTSPTQDPWRFRRILVQECVSDRFKKSIAWKAKLKADSADGSTLDIDLPDIKRLSSDLYIYDNKIFAHEYAGAQDSKKVILIEEYRTVKELMSLIDSYSPFCVSLWSSDVAATHEISYGITTPLVWVNDYGVLGVPIGVSEAYYSRIFNSRLYKTICELSGSKLDSLSQMEKDWVKLTPDERRSKVLGALKSSFVETQSTQDFYSYENFVNRVYREDNNFVHVDANTLIIGLDVPRLDCSILYFEDEAKFMKGVTELFSHLLAGKGIIVYVLEAFETDDYAKFINRLNDFKVPVQMAKESRDLSAVCYSRKTRIIHTSLGTIFAN